MRAWFVRGCSLYRWPLAFLTLSNRAAWGHTAGLRLRTRVLCPTGSLWLAQGVVQRSAAARELKLTYTRARARVCTVDMEAAAIARGDFEASAAVRARGGSLWAVAKPYCPSPARNRPFGQRGAHEKHACELCRTTEYRLTGGPRQEEH
jgi:hypothetical protein